VADSGCENLDVEEIRRILTIELAGDRVDPTDQSISPEDQTAIEVTLICEGGSIRIIANNESEEPPLERSIEHLETKLKERFIALSVSQLLTTSKIDDKPDSEPSPDREQAPVNHPVNAPPDRSDMPVVSDKGIDHLELSLAGGIVFHDIFHFHTGSAHLRGDIWFTRETALLVLLSFEMGEAHKDIGSVTVMGPFIGLGVGRRFGGTGMLSIEISGAALAGYVHLTGNPGDNATAKPPLDGITGVFFLTGAPVFRISGFLMALDIRGGYTIENPIGKVVGEDPVTLGGFWAGVGLRFGASF